MLDGTREVYPHKHFHIDVYPNAKPVYSQPYPVPHIHLSTFNTELDHIVEVGVLVRQNKSGWVSPTSIVIKQGGQVR